MNSNIHIHMEVTAQITLSESELRALNAIMKYGPEKFIEGFYKQLGKNYLKPHAHAVPGLFKSVQSQIAPALAKIDDAKFYLKEGGIHCHFIEGD